MAWNRYKYWLNSTFSLFGPSIVKKNDTLFKKKEKNLIQRRIETGPGDHFVNILKILIYFNRKVGGSGVRALRRFFFRNTQKNERNKKRTPLSPAPPFTVRNAISNPSFS